MYLHQPGTVQKKNRAMTAGSTASCSSRAPATPARAHAAHLSAYTAAEHRHLLRTVRLIPRTKKRMALKVALTDRAREGRIFIVESFNFDKPNTKKALEPLGKIAPEKGRKLVVTDPPCADGEVVHQPARRDDRQSRWPVCLRSPQKQHHQRPRTLYKRLRYSAHDTSAYRNRAGDHRKAKAR